MYRAAFPSQLVFRQMMNQENRNDWSGQNSKFSYPTVYTGCVEMVPLMSLDGTATTFMTSNKQLNSQTSKHQQQQNGLSLDISGHDYRNNNNYNRVRSCSGDGGCSYYTSSSWSSGSHYISKRNGKNFNYEQRPQMRETMESNDVRQSTRSPEISVIYSRESSTVATITPNSITNKGTKRRLDISPVASLIDNSSCKAEQASVNPHLNNRSSDDPDVVYIATKRKSLCAPEEFPPETTTTRSIDFGLKPPINPIDSVASFTSHNGFSLPNELMDGSAWDKLSYQIWNKSMACKQSEDMFEKKMRLHGVLTRIMKESYPSCGLYVVGSSMNTFGTNRSDMDTCLMLTDSDIDQRIDALNILQGVLLVIRNFDFFVKAELIRAKVPIVEFKDSVSGVEVDLNINNAVGIRNTYLLRAYSNLDWRVCPLVLLVKIWARVHDINDAKNMTISSYSLALMVIHFLQYGVKPAVLPCLQKLFPHKFLPEQDVRTLSLDEKFQVPPSLNCQSLGQLLWGFLEYFTNDFDYQEEAISVRLGRRIPKNYVKYHNVRKNTPGMWNYLCIEEPFDMTNTARSVYDEEVFRRIKNVFLTSFTRLDRTKDLSAIM